MNDNELREYLKDSVLNDQDDGYLIDRIDSVFDQLEEQRQQLAGAYTEEDCKRDTNEHIAKVAGYLGGFAQALLQRAKVHDASKLESPELEIFTEYTPRLENSTYGTDDYYANLKEMKVALEHHYASNSHHPEHYPDGIQGMDLLDVVEMYCDWKAAVLRHNDGDMLESIDINQKRFKMSDDLTEIFKNTFINEKGE